jgi:multidrug efflux system membrane fusion protein
MRNRETVELSIQAPPKAGPHPLEPELQPEPEGEPPAPTPRRRWWIWGAVAAALVLLWLLRAQLAPLLPGPVAGWLGLAKTGGFAPPPRLVGVAKVIAKEVPVQVSAIGSIDPLRTVNVKSRVDGTIVAVKFKPGDAVKAGQVLFQLDDRPAQSALLQARAAVDRDLATLENQKREFARQEQLMAAKITTQQDFDAARTAVAVTTQTIAVDRAAIETARLTLEYATIRAPIGGRTGKVLIDLGNVVKANDTVAMVTINQIQPIYVTFSVPQRYLSEVRERYLAGRLPVSVTAPESEKVLAEGRLDFVDNSVDSSTGTIALRAIFANEAETLWPGQFVSATLVLHNDPTALTLPPEAVQTGREGSFVYAVKADNTVQFRPVTVDRIVNGSAVLSKGVAAGELIVTDGQLNLVDGSRVQVAGAPSPAPHPGERGAAGKPGDSGAAGGAGAGAAPKAGAPAGAPQTGGK